MANALDHIGLSLDDIFPSCPCVSVDGDNEERQQHALNDKCLSYVINKESGKCRWDTIMDGRDHLRLVLCPDQGGPLYAAYQFLAGANASIGFVRDELPLRCKVNILFHFAVLPTVYSSFVLGCADLSHKLHAHCGRTTSCSQLVKRPFSGICSVTPSVLLLPFNLKFLSLCPEMTLLSGWLFRAKKSPWNTSNFASTLKEAGERYLEVVPLPQAYAISIMNGAAFTYSLQVACLSALMVEAHPDDVLMELFSRDILRERLGFLVWNTLSVNRLHEWMMN